MSVSMVTYVISKFNQWKVKRSSFISTRVNTYERKRVDIYK